MRNNNASRSFTLVELLMSICLVGVLSLVVYTTLSNGIRLWRRMSQDLVLTDANIFLDRFDSDIKNSFVFTGINCTGSPERLECVALVKDPQFEGKTVGKILYVYDQNKNELQRQFKGYSEIYTGGQAHLLAWLGNIRSFSFAYYCFDKEKKEYQWKKEWLDTLLPLAVQMTLELSDDTKTYNLTRTVVVPCAR